MEMYEHIPLDLTKPYVRFVKLKMGFRVDPIECEIFQGLLGESEGGIPYEALSYTWGNTDNRVNLCVDGLQMKITPSLHTALLHLRCYHRDRILWIDGICIDQNNNDEKNHQVRQMSNIYKQAGSVIIWLGEGTVQTNDAMDAIQCVEPSIPGIENPWPLNLDLPNKYHSGLRDLWARRWFQRAWILQEVAHARIADVQCGSKLVPAHKFAHAPRTFIITSDPHCQSVLDLMIKSPQGLSENRKLDLRTLLVKFCQSEASDPRDIVYALLSISEAYDNIMLRADYTKAPREVLNETMSFILSPRPIDPPEIKHWTLPDILKEVALLSTVPHGRTLEVELNAWITLLTKQFRIDINEPSHDGTTALELAMKRDYQFVSKHIEKLLEKVKPADTEHQLPMWLASKMDIYMSYIINEHKTFRVTGIVALSITAQCVRIEGFEAPSKPFYPNIKGTHIGVLNGLSIHQYPEVNVRCNKDTTLLHIASKRGYTDIVEQLLLHPYIAVNIQDYRNHTPLHIAVKDGRTEIVRLLLDHPNIAVNIQDYSNHTPLHIAVKDGRTEIVRLLLDHPDIAVNIQDYSNQTPLHIAAELYDCTEIVRLLLDRPDIAVNIQDNYTQTPLHIAIQCGHRKIIRLLLKHPDIAVNIQDFSKRMLLLIAVGSSFMKIVRLWFLSRYYT